MKYLVVYDSKSGNTKKLAEHIFEYLDEDSKEIKTVEEYIGTEEADLYYIGFCTNRGSCSMELADILEKLEGKKIALFGTCGMGNSSEYYDKIRKNIDVWMPEDYEDVGFFMCQGKMSEKVRNKYEMLEGQMPEEQRVEILHQFENGLTHPDLEDLQALEVFVDKVTDNIKDWEV